MHHSSPLIQYLIDRKLTFSQFAASSLQVELAEYLLQSGADPHARDWRRN
jgi:DNA-binding transcriptional MocR family regulator